MKSVIEVEMDIWKDKAWIRRRRENHVYGWNQNMGWVHVRDFPHYRFSYEDFYFPEPEAHEIAQQLREALAEIGE